MLPWAIQRTRRFASARSPAALPLSASPSRTQVSRGSTSSSPRSPLSPALSSSTDTLESRTSATSRERESKRTSDSPTSISSSPPLPANPSPAPVCEKASPILEDSSASASPKSARTRARRTSSGKTSRARSTPIKGRLSDKSSLRWMTSGTTSRGAYSTRSMPDWLNDGSVCSLSDVLETRLIPARYFLTPKACLGILLRADRRGRKLPALLKHALGQAAKVPDLMPTGPPPAICAS